MLIVSAAVPMELLFRAEGADAHADKFGDVIGNIVQDTSDSSFAFTRTLSRLQEMSSNAYTLRSKWRDHTIRQAFQVFDGDRSGKITCKELVDILSQPAQTSGAPEPFSEEQARELIARFDKDGDGELDYGEFVEAFSSISPLLELNRVSVWC